VEGRSRILEIIGCHKKGLHPKKTNKLHGSIYLETTASLNCIVLGEIANQNSPIFENLNF
tara:strand:- start:1822 stop:2001 length:180 start_codon:yes stop_codon:yes gene_type:complete